MRMLGILGTKISPPCIAPRHRMTKSDALLERDPEARHARSVTVTRPLARCAAKSGITLPRLPMTLP